MASLPDGVETRGIRKRGKARIMGVEMDSYREVVGCLVDAY